MLRTLPLLGLILLTGCSSAGPKPLPEDNHAFSFDTGQDGETEFVFTYFGEEAAPDPRLRRLQQRPTSDSGPVPGSGAYVDEHQLFLLLERELDANELCLDGYRIIKRRPTRHGITMQGRCAG
ncbi:hypothetical protein [Ferrimonas marina]|uniref:Lipoprotein n=1 Tax=Ferrimonas marina TaxID=299255 RepID=A0A1M5VRG6_9GAMM|nr:hypothetical protein [Ferrimonas marina]SHH77849.1 hypothetical protein SAMN02745129_2940 [Ferrimonas marina]